jgi:hypothetical protein
MFLHFWHFLTIRDCPQIAKLGIADQNWNTATRYIPRVAIPGETVAAFSAGHRTASWPSCANASTTPTTVQTLIEEIIVCSQLRNARLT